MLSEDEDEYIQNLILGFEKSYQPYMPTLIKGLEYIYTDEDCMNYINTLFQSYQSKEVISDDSSK